jgi:esterase/lipase
MLNSEEAKKQIDELVETLNYHSHRYYVLDNPEISDYDYDMMQNKLKELEAEYPQYVRNDSPTQRVGGEAVSTFEKVTHKVQMGSLSDVFSFSQVEDFVNKTNENVIAPEFPGYGIYSGYPKEEQIFQDSLSVYDYMTKELNIPSNNIIIFGRSLGTSVGTFLASQRPATALVLISPLLSIRYVVKDMLGKFVSYAVRDRFKNYEMIEQVQFPILIIHGQNDSLIKYYHATELYNRSKAPCELILPENMDHNEFDFFHEFSEPLLDFISRNAIFAYTETCQPKLPQSLFEVPEEFKEPPKNWNCLNTLLKKFSLS